MQQCWRHASTAAVNSAAKQGGRHRKWLWAGAGVAGIGVLSSTVVPQQQQHGSGPAGMENPQQPTSALGFLQQQLSRAASALWPTTSSSKQQQQQQADSPSFASEALATARATSARWLAQWAEDPEAREALLAFGSRRLLDFLIDTATEDPSPEQAHAEQALCNFLAGHHTCSRLLARPGAVPRLLQHVASGKASEELVAALHDVINTRGADFKQQGLREEDGQELIGMLGGRQGQQVQGLALQFLTAWAAAGQTQARLLSQQGLAPALGLLAMDAVAQGEAGRGLQAAVCRLQRVMLSQQGAVSDAELAGWMQPLLFMAADAAAAAAAAAAGAGKGIIALSTPLPSAAPDSSRGSAAKPAAAAAGGGVLGLAAGADDLALADSAMTTLAAAVVAGGPEVRAASRGLHLLPTLDCLALSPDPAMKSRAAAALAALVTAGLVESEEARTRWRDMLLGWLISSTASTLKKPPSASSSSSSSSEQEEEDSWFLSSWFKGSSSSSSEKEGGDGADAADAALARSCVAALRALSQEPGPAGLSVTQLWLSRLLLQLSSRVAAYTSITTLAPTAAPAVAATSSSSSSSGSSILRRALPSALADSPAAAAGPNSTGSAPGFAAADPAAAAAAAGPGSHGLQGSQADTSPASLATADAAEADSVDLGAGNAAASTGYEPPAGLSSGSSSSSISSGSSWWGLGGRWWWWGNSSTSSSGGTAPLGPHAPPNNVSNNVTDNVWSQLEAAKAAHWRDAAPVTPAYARSAAEELKAASLAMLSSWQAAAQQLALPSDLMPGMFAPAVVEAYPAAARVVDYSVAQQRTTHVMELLAAVVAEDPAKQAWLLAAGILPIMERLVLHADAGLDPEGFVAKYSSSSSSGNAGGSSGDAGGGGGDEGGDDSGSGLSLSARIGRGLWGWGGSSSSSSGSGVDEVGAQAVAGDNDSKLDKKTMTDSSSTDKTGDSSSTYSTGVGNVQAVQQDAVAAAMHSGVQQPLLLGWVGSGRLGLWPASWQSSSSSTEHHAVSAGTSSATDKDHQQQQQRQSQLWVPVHYECEFGCELHSDVKSWRDSDSTRTATAAAAGSNGAALRTLLASGGPLTKFKAAALSPHSSSSSSDTASSDAGKDTGSTAQRQQQQQYKPSQQQQQQQPVPPAILMEFAQGAASWDLNPTNTPDPAADAATAITAAAEEHPSWVDGEGLGFLCLQRQVARLLGMLALQPAAAGQLAGAAQELPGGALGVLGLLGNALNPIRPGSRPQTQGLLLQQGRQHGSGAGSSSSSSWLPWLLAAAASDDCLLSSYAVMALLHLESAAAHHQHELRMQQRRYRHHHLQQQLGVLGPNGSSSSSSSSEAGGWRQRIAQELQELQSAEDFAAFLEDIWPFNSSSSSSSSGSGSSSSSDGVWRPPMYFPDGIHLLNPTDSHHWGLLQPPKITLLESLTAAATAAASAAVAAAASDLSQFDIDASDAAALDPAAAAAAAAAAATAAASALGADTSQLQHSNTAGMQGPNNNSSSSSGAVTGGSSSTVPAAASTSRSRNSSSTELGFLQPAVVWLAQKLVKVAEIKEEQVVQEQQRQAHAASQEGCNPAAPLSTFAAVQALLSGTSPAGPGVVSEQQQQQHFPAEPEFDVVFIHGIRGGPFVTWRKGGAHRHPAAARSTDTSASAAAESGGSSSSKGRSSIPLTPSAAMSAHKNHMTRADCWPASWLAADMPGARLLSVEYKAPVTGWEGESLSLPDSGRLLLDKLVAAGVGERPVVFVAHSMGGLLVKEMLSLSLDEAPGSKRGRLAASTKAIAFYSTPHFGSSMAALGWKLRHLPGASPAPSIHHLSPGPHLAALNARLAFLHESGRVQVLSFTEGLPTSLAGLGFIPKILIVPFESAYPGFGAVHVLGAQDHIDVCKPDSRQAPAYAELLQFVRGSMAAAGVAAAAVAAGLEDADASSSSSRVEEGDSGAGTADAQQATAGADEVVRAAE